MLEMMFDGFDNHDRIIDDDADRQDQTKKRKVVKAVSQSCHDSERSHDRDRNRNQRNQRRSP